MQMNLQIIPNGIIIQEKMFSEKKSHLSSLEISPEKFLKLNLKCGMH